MIDALLDVTMTLLVHVGIVALVIFVDATPRAIRDWQAMRTRHKDSHDT